jgi:hypothetical protein
MPLLRSFITFAIDGYKDCAPNGASIFFVYYKNRHAVLRRVPVDWSRKVQALPPKLT